MLLFLKIKNGSTFFIFVNMPLIFSPSPNEKILIKINESLLFKNITTIALQRLYTVNMQLQMCKLYAMFSARL